MFSALLREPLLEVCRNAPTRRFRNPSLRFGQKIEVTLCLPIPGMIRAAACVCDITTFTALHQVTGPERVTARAASTLASVNTERRPVAHSSLVLARVGQFYSWAESSCRSFLFSGRLFRHYLNASHASKKHKVPPLHRIIATR